MSGKPTAGEIARRVRRAGASRLDRRDIPGTGGVDLSPEAIAARRAAGGGGHTGAELIDRAGRVLDRANQLAKVASRGKSRRAQRASAAADQALLTAAKQIRTAERTPLDRGYLHALTIEQLQTVDAEVTKAMREDSAALAVDTHRRIREQKLRRMREAGRR